MDTITQQKIAEYYAKLPQNVQTIFSSMAWMDTLQTISDTYKLLDEQKETLATETTLVFLGMIHPEEYESILIDEIDLPKETIDKMISEINEAIFKPIKMDLIQTYTTNAETLVTEVYGDGKNLDERFAKLPTDIQQVIGSLNYQKSIVDIGKKFNLTVDQLGALEEVTTKVMLGIVHPGEYRNALASKLLIPKEKIDELVTEVNTKIFLEIRESFMKMFDNDLDTPRSSQNLNQTTSNVRTENIAGKIVEVEEDHSRLDRDDLLSQIENPVPLGSKPVKPVVVDDINNHIPEPAKIAQAEIDTLTKTVTEKPQVVGSMENLQEIPPVESIPTMTPIQEERKTVATGIPSFLKDKLAGTTVSEPTTMDHSLPKLGGTPPENLPVQSVDPYHEAL